MSITPTADLGGAEAHRRSSSPSLTFKEDWATVGVIGLILAEHFAFGGNRGDLGLLFALLQGVLLLAVLWTPWGRSSLSRAPGWGVAAGLFAVVVLAALLALVPLPFGGDAIWRAVGERPRAAINPGGLMIEVAKLLGLGCVFTVGAVLASDRRRSAILMKALVIAGLAFSLICLVLSAISPIDVFGWVKPVIAQHRVSGVFSSANTAATVFGLNALLAAGPLIGQASAPKGEAVSRFLMRLVSRFSVELTAFLLSLGCLLLTASRGGIAAFAAAFLVLLFWPRRPAEGPQSPMPRLVLGGVVMFLLVVSGGFALERYLHAATTQDARPVWALLTWRLFEVAPLQGYGLGSMQMVYQSLTSPATYGTVSWAGSAHNVYLQWLAEGGLLACIPFLGLLAWIGRLSLLAIPSDGNAGVWRPTLVACSLLVLVHSLVEYSLQEPSIASFWSLLLGISLGFSARRKVGSGAADSLKAPVLPKRRRASSGE